VAGDPQPVGRRPRKYGQRLGSAAQLAAAMRRPIPRTSMAVREVVAAEQKLEVKNDHFAPILLS
jgi:hypothetical protein